MCEDEVGLSHRLEILEYVENNVTADYSIGSWLGSSLSADTNIMSLLQREHHEILAGIGGLISFKLLPTSLAVMETKRPKCLVQVQGYDQEFKNKTKIVRPRPNK